MTLLQKQQLFSRMVAALILKAYEMGYQLTLGEAYRPKFVADHYAEDGSGIKNSLHCIRLAIDVNLFKDGAWLQKNSDFRELGIWWESQSTLDYSLCWGGKFGDGNHFSMVHEGVK